MTSRQKRIQLLLLQQVLRTEPNQSYSAYETYNKIFKPDGLVASNSFIEGRLIQRHEFEQVVKVLMDEGLLARRTLNWDIHFSFDERQKAAIEERLRALSSEGVEEPKPETVEDDWEKIKSIQIGPSNSEAVIKAIDEALNALPSNKLGNDELMQAASYLRAAKILAEAPSPPSEIIWDLIQKAAAIAGIGQILVLVFSRLF